MSEGREPSTLLRMDDRRLVRALRAREPGAPAALYDAYANRLYAYCWFLLRERDAAQVALREALIVADAHVDRLRDPDRLAPWLYAVARLECHRRLPGRALAPDLPVATHDQDDVDQRVMAWQAVLALDVLSREALELRVRHRLPVTDLAAILDLPVRAAQLTLDRAHTELGAALTAEILAHQGPYGCEARGRLLRERHHRHGQIDAALRRALLRHTEECPVCGAFRPRAISAAKVFGLLPQAEPPEELRVRVMSGFLGPELADYRLFVATRVSDFAPSGFPVQARPREPSRAARVSQHGSHNPALRFLHRLAVPRRPASCGASNARGGSGARDLQHAAARRLAVGCVSAALLISGGTAVARALLPPQHHAGTSMGETSPDEAVPTAISQPPPRDPEASDDDGARMPVSATFPLGALASSAPPFALPWPPAPGDLRLSGGAGAGGPGPRGGTLSAAPLFLDLADRSHGTIELRASGGPVAWSARPWGAVRPSATSGRLVPGRAVRLTVQVSRTSRSQGEGGLILNPGRIEVRVIWRPVTVPEPEPGSSTPSRAPVSPTDPSSPPPASPTEPPASRPPAPSDPPSDPSRSPATPSSNGASGPKPGS